MKKVILGSLTFYTADKSLSLFPENQFKYDCIAARNSILNICKVVKIGVSSYIDYKQHVEIYEADLDTYYKELNKFHQRLSYKIKGLS